VAAVERLVKYRAGRDRGGRDDVNAELRSSGSALDGNALPEVRRGRASCAGTRRAALEALEQIPRCVSEKTWEADLRPPRRERAGELRLKPRTVGGCETHETIATSTSLGSGTAAMIVSARSPRPVGY
jgi:hypothetical protein